MDQKRAKRGYYFDLKDAFKPQKNQKVGKLIRG
jgi:hypothetical protein